MVAREVHLAHPSGTDRTGDFVSADASRAG
jgi:hypothetical protein